MEKRIITKKEVEHVAWLARIELSEEEKDTFTKQFNAILEYFEKISEAKTEDVPPTYHVLELVNVQREDSVTPSLTAKESMMNAPKKQERFYRAPKMI